MENGRVVLEEFGSGGGEVEVVFVGGGGRDGEGFGRLRQDQVFEGKELFKVFLFLDCIVEVWISDPFDSSLHEGSEVEVLVKVGVETAKEVVGLGGRGCEQNHRGYALSSFVCISNGILSSIALAGDSTPAT